MTVLVAGASGTTGSQVAFQLAEFGTPVRAMTRSPEKLAALEAPGVEPVVAAFDDPDSLAAALDGVSAAYLVTTAAADMASTEGAFAVAAAKAGVHLVKLSALGADPASSSRFGRAHGEAEAAIEAAGGTWTFVQATGFMQNDLAWAAQIPGGTIAGPVMDAAWSIVDVADVAAVAVAALSAPDEHAGKRLVVTGPAPLTPRARIAALAELLVLELDVVDVPLSALEEQLTGYGLDAWTAGGLVELFGMYAGGGAEAVSEDVEHVLGRRAGSWQAFITQEQASFRAG